MFVERVCAEAITRANRRIYDALAEPLSDTHRHHLDDLLKRRDNGKTTWLAWLRQSPAKPNSRHMLEHIERLKAWQALDLPSGIERLVHQNRLLKIAREGGQMTPADLNLLLTTILADAINLGLTKMAESCPGTTYAMLAWLQAWHIRDETYGTALAELVNAQFRHPFAEHWGDGTTSSSDGQNFRTGSKAESTGHINPKYGSSPGRTFYTHISDQ